MCRGGTLQSATRVLRICFGTSRQWCVKFLPRIFYPFWVPHGQKLQIGLFDRCATKWCFWLACDQNLGSVILRCDHESNFWNFDLKRLRTFTPMVPKVSLQDFLLFLAPYGRKLRIGLFDRCATKWCFWPSYDQNLCWVFLTIVRPGNASKICD